MEQYCIYLAVKQILSSLNCPDNAPTYGVLSDIKENALGVYIVGRTILRNRLLSSGKYCRKANTVRLRMQSGKTAESIMNWETFNNKLINLAPSLCNVEYKLDKNIIGFDAYGNITRTKSDITSGIKVMFIRTDTPTGVENRGRSSQGLTRYRCDLAIEYNIASYALN